MLRAFHIVQRNGVALRRHWRGAVIWSFLQPSIYLAAMGLGVGALVDRGGAQLPGGVSYLVFLGPGLLASTCMQTGSFESSFPVLGRMRWQKTYEAVAGTPMSVRDIVFGEFLWVVARLAVVALGFSTVLAVFGGVTTPLFVLAVPAAVLTGAAFCAPVMAYAASLRNGINLNALIRFVITPLFLFSGTFFPISRLPRLLQQVAAVTPLYHGVELTRGLALNTLTWPAALVHVGYLAVLTLVGLFAAMRVFKTKLHA